MLIFDALVFALDKNELYMHRCLHLAQLGEGNVAPNPMVGAVLVYDDKIIGEGYHKQFGEAHAEVVCLHSVPAERRHLIAQSTLYVSLEPCSHFGKTPPCTDLIRAHKIPRVVVGCADPFKEVSGKGIQQLQAAGIEVTIGVLEKECRRLNERFITFQEQQRPYIILKWAQTADGNLANASYKRTAISNMYTNRLVHRWRSQNSSILVGTNTALFDDPELTTRLWPGKNAVRLVLDKTLRLPVMLRLFDGRKQTIVFNTLLQETHPNLLYYRLSGAGSIVQQLTQALYDLKLQSVLVEGGAQLLQAFINEGLWDEVVTITNQSMTLEKGLAAPRLQHHRLVESKTIFSDVLQNYVHKNNVFYD